MEHSKKIVRTSRVTGRTVTTQQSNQLLRRTQRRSPNVKISQLTESQLRNKSSGSLQLSKSSEGSPLTNELSKIQKKESFEIILNEQELKMQKQFYQLKKMQLSTDFKEKLIQLQRYDENFRKRSKQLLSDSLQTQMKRLTKNKNQQVEMKSTFYDTQLLVTCLYYYQKQIQNVQTQLEQIKTSKMEMEHQLSTGSNEQSITESKSIGKQSFNLKKDKSQKQLTKQLQTAINFALRALSNKQYPQSRRQISTFIQKAMRQNSYDFYIKILQKTSSLITDLQKMELKISGLENQNAQIIKNIDLSNKYVRQAKWTDLRKVQDKLKQNKSIRAFLNLYLLIESVSQLNQANIKEKQSRSREKVQNSPDNNQINQIQKLKKEIDHLKLQIQKEKRSTSKVLIQRQNLSRRLEEVQKEHRSCAYSKQSQKNVNILSRQVQDQKKSFESRTKSLEQSKKLQEDKVSMLQKKNASLQLSLKTKEQQVKQLNFKLLQVQKSMNDALIKIQKLEKNKETKISIQGQKVSIEELRNLQKDFDDLLKEKEEQEYNLLKIIEEKQSVINQYQTKIMAMEADSTIKGSPIVQLQLQEKDKQLIKLKKQLIESLQSKESFNQQSKKNSKAKQMQLTVKKGEESPKQANEQSNSPIQSLLSEIFEIRQKKNTESLSKGLRLEFNSMQREEWREVSKKIKEYRKRYPNNKFFAFLDQKHKYQFDLTQKLTDYEQKLLAIHNQLYRIKAIVTGKANHKDNKQKWWQNVSVIFVNENTQFAKLFNDLISQIHRILTKNKFDLIKSPASQKQTQINKISEQKGERDEMEKIAKIKQEMGQVDQRMKEIIKVLNGKDEDLYSNAQFLGKSVQQIKESSFLPSIHSTVTTLIKSISFSLNNRELYHRILQSEQSTTIKNQQEQLINKEKQLNQVRTKLVQCEKEKKILEKNLSYKDQSLQEKEQLKERVFQLQNQANQLSRVLEQSNTSAIQFNGAIAQISNVIKELITISPQQLDKSKLPVLNLPKLLTSVQQNKSTPGSKVITSVDKDNKFHSLSDLVNQINILCQRYYELLEERAEINQKVPTLQLTNEELARQLEQLNELEEVFRYILDNKILNAKLASLPALIQHEGTINKDPEIIRQIYIDHIKHHGSHFPHTHHPSQANNSKQGTPYNMFKKQNVSPEEISQSGLSDFTFKTTVIEEHHNSIIQTILKLFSKVNEMHIQYQDSISGKYEESRIRINEHNQSLKSEILILQSQLSDKQLQLSQRQSHLSLIQTQLKQIQSQLQQKQSTIQHLERRMQSKELLAINSDKNQHEQSIKYRQLYDEYNKLEKQSRLTLKQLQRVKKQLEQLKRQAEDQCSFLQKLITLQSNTPESLSTKTNQAQDKKEPLSSKTSQSEQRKEILNYRRKYPKSKLLTYIQTINKKLVSIESYLSQVQEQEKNIINFYRKWIQQQEKGQKEKKISQRLPQTKDRNGRKSIGSSSRGNDSSNRSSKGLESKTPGNGEVACIIRELVQKKEQISSQLSVVSNKLISLQLRSSSLESSSKELSLLNQSLELFSSCLQSVKKTIESWSRPVFKNKDQFILNQKYLKNLLQEQMKKRKISDLQNILQPLNNIFCAFGIASKNLYNLKLQELSTSKRQKEQLRTQITSLNSTIAQLQSILSQHQSTISRLQQEISLFESSAKSSQNNLYELQRLKQTLQTYLSKESQLQLKIGHLEKQTREKQRQIDKLKGQKQKLAEQIQDSTQQKLTLTKLIESLKIKHVQNENSLEQNQALIRTLKANYQKTEAQLQAIESRISVLLEEKALLQQQMIQLKQDQRKEKISLQKQIKAQKSLLQRQTAQSNQLQHKCEQLNVKIKHLESTHQLQINLNKKLQSQLKALALKQSKEKEDLQKKIVKLQQQNSKLQQKHSLQVQEYNQMLMQHDIQATKQKSAHIESVSKDIEQINSNYTNLLKQHQLQKVSLNAKVLTLTEEKENIINTHHQQRLSLIKEYEQTITELKQSSIRETQSLNSQIDQFKQQNSQLKTKVIHLEQSMTASSQEQLKLSSKLSSVENLLSQTQHKLQLTESRLTESEKSILRLTPFERKTLEYESILIQNNISLTDSHTHKSSPIHNTLAQRLKQSQKSKQQIFRLQSQIQSLTFHLQKQQSQRQFIQSQCLLTRQDYIKLSAQSKEEIRHLREQVKSIASQKQMLQTQLVHYKESIKHLHSQQHELQEQLRLSKSTHDKEKYSLSEPHMVKIQFLQRQLSEKSSLINDLQLQLSQTHKKLHQSEQLVSATNIQVIQLSSKLKQAELRYKSQREKHEIILNSVKSQSQSQSQALKEQLKKTNLQLQLSSRDLIFLRTSLQQKSNSCLSLVQQLQSQQKIHKTQKQNYESKLTQIQSTMLKLEEKIESNLKAQQTQRTLLESQQSSVISELKQQIIEKSRTIHETSSKIQHLEALMTQKENKLQQGSRYNKDLEHKLQIKLKDYAQLTKTNLQLDMKNKELQRTYKFESLQLKAQVDFQKRTYHQLQLAYNQLLEKYERQPQSTKPFSPCSSLKASQVKPAPSQILFNLEHQNTNLKKQLEQFKLKYQEMQSNSSQLKIKNSELMLFTEKLNRLQVENKLLNSQLATVQSQSQSLILKNKELQHLKLTLQQQLAHLHHQYFKKAQSSRLEQEQLRNSQRVLDHQLIQYKAKLQNLQQCLKQERQKNYCCRIQLQNCKRERLQGQISPKNMIKSSHLLESQLSSKLQEKHELQKKLIIKDFQVKQLKQSQSSLKTVVQNLTQQNRRLINEIQALQRAQEANLAFIESQNHKLKQIFQALELNQHKKIQTIRHQSLNEMNLLVEVSDKVNHLVSQNESLERKTSELETRLHSIYLKSGTEIKSEEVTAHFLEKIIKQLFELAQSYKLIPQQHSTSIINFPNFQQTSLSVTFQKAQKNLSQLIMEISKSNTQGELIQRYQWSIQRMKRLIRLYLQNHDPNAYHSLKELSNT